MFVQPNMWNSRSKILAVQKSCLPRKAPEGVLGLAANQPRLVDG